MYYCRFCGHETKEDLANCPKCGQAFGREELTNDDARKLVQMLHKNENFSREKNDTAMVFIILGLISLILGGLFFILAFKLIDVADEFRTLSTTAFEFWVSLFLLITGSAILIYGLIVLIIHLGKLKRLGIKIAEVREKYLDKK
ncbi:MAG: hypothetical protein WC344_01330 [Bacilli bacterium]|jgi:hypothetical protein